MTLRGICFDLFNTLIDVATVPESVGRFTADILGIDREAWRLACFGPMHDICRPTDALPTLRKLAHSIDPEIPELLVQQAVIERQQRFDYALLNIDVSILAMLNKLKQQGLKLALVSNASSSEVSAWQRSPLADYFDTATFSWETGLQKPQPDIYLFTLQALGLAAVEVIYIGDGGSEEHVGATQVGLRSVMVNYFLSAATRSNYKERYAGLLHAEASSPAEVLEILGVV